MYIKPDPVAVLERRIDPQEREIILGGKFFASKHFPLYLTSDDISERIPAAQVTGARMISAKNTFRRSRPINQNIIVGLYKSTSDM